MSDWVIVKVGYLGSNFDITQKIKNIYRQDFFKYSNSIIIPISKELPSKENVIKSIFNEIFEDDVNVEIKAVTI